MDISNYKTCKTTQCNSLVKVVAQSGKTAFIIDKSAVLKTFFNYSAHLCSVVGFIIENAMAGKTEDPKEIGNKMREAYISSAKHGTTCVYNFGGSVSNLGKYIGTEDQTFRPEIIFDPSKNHERDYIMKIVKPSEDTDRFGGRGLFPQLEMQVAVLCETDDDEGVLEIIKEARAALPDFDKLFEVYINSN